MDAGTYGDGLPDVYAGSDVHAFADVSSAGDAYPLPDLYQEANLYSLPDIYAGPVHQHSTSYADAEIHADPNCIGPVGNVA